jgi:hypothetical protein
MRSFIVKILSTSVLFVWGAAACSSQKAIVISIAGGTDAPSQTGTGSSTSTATSTGRTLFRDPFDGGYEVNWFLSDSSNGLVKNDGDGSNRFVILDSTDSEYCRLKYNLDGSKFKDIDLSASFKVRVDEKPPAAHDVRLNVRQSAGTENIYYAVGAVIGDDGSMTKIGIFKKVFDGKDNYTICSLKEEAFATPVEMKQWRTFGLTLRGTDSVELTAYFEGVQMASFVDDCASSLLSKAGVTVPNGGCLADQTGIGLLAERGIVASVDDIEIKSY